MSDADRSRAFYRDVLGFEVRPGTGEEGVESLAEVLWGPARIRLVPQGEQGGEGRRIVFLETDDVGGDARVRGGGPLGQPPHLHPDLRVMAIIPTIRCSHMRRSLAFYTGVLDFERVDGDDDLGDPSFSVLSRGGDRLFLSSHRGDGEFGQAVVVTTDGIDALFRKFQDRGLRTPGRPESPVHEGPVDQTWGTREFYVDDPDDNTLRFVQE